jgi:hypothetical protein
MTVKAFKLVSGEDIIAEVINDNDLTCMIKSPAVIVVQRSEAGQVGVGLQPYTPFASGNVTLHKTSFIADFEVDVSLTNEYNRIFGSGIVIANTMPGM